MSEEISKNDIFLKGKNVILKVLTEDDIHNSNWYGWFNDEETTKFMQKHYFPNTKEAQLEFYRKEIVGNDKKLQLGICDVKGGPIIGVVSLNNIDYINRSANFSIVIGEAKYRKVKYMIEAIELILTHAFNTLNLHRISDGSLSNELVELYCRTFDFKREGIFRKAVFKNGKYHDVYLYGISKEEFENRKLVDRD